MDVCNNMEAWRHQDLRGAPMDHGNRYRNFAYFVQILLDFGKLYTFDERWKIGNHGEIELTELEHEKEKNIL